MNRHAFFFVLIVLEGCARPTPAPTPAATSAATPAATSADSLDARAPVPLLPMMANHQKQSMRDHLKAVEEIVGAIASDDFAGVEKAAGRIGFSQQMGKMCTHMGSGAPGFTEQAIAFHHTADQIVEAARSRDRAQVLTTLSNTLQACTSCHAAWKQQIVDENTWQRLTASTAPTAHH